MGLVCELCVRSVRLAPIARSELDAGGQSATEDAEVGALVGGLGVAGTSGAGVAHVEEHRGDSDVVADLELVEAFHHVASVATLAT